MNYQIKSKLRPWDVETDLHHFALITFYVDPEKIQKLIHPRFEVVTVKDKMGQEKALLSVVPFLDKDFHIKFLPFLKFNFGQTNYRVYVRDTVSGDQVVWFLGTTLGSWLNIIPRFLWKLPWHYGKLEFKCDYKVDRYETFSVKTTSKWAANEFTILDLGTTPKDIPGFQSYEEGMYLLTHPLKGFYYKRNGKLGCYNIWHAKLEMTEGRLLSGKFDLLEKLDLWKKDNVHSVLIQPKTEFAIYLPPKDVK